MGWDLFSKIQITIQPAAKYTKQTMRSMNHKSGTEDLLRLLVESVSSKTGEEFFNTLVRSLASAFGARYSLISERKADDKDEVKTLAVWDTNHFVDNFEYPLAGTPCENVIKGDICYYPNNIRSRFPEDKDLIELNAESYLGIPILDSSNNVIGHLSAIDINPMEINPHNISILKIFAARAATEMERLAVEKALKTSENKYRMLFERESDAVMVLDGETLQFEDANQATLELFGYKKEEYLKLKVWDISNEKEKTRSTIQSVLKKQPVELSLRVHGRECIKKNGTIFLAEISGGTYISNGRKKIVAALRDISEQVRAAEAIRYSEDRYRQLFNNSNDMLFVHELNADNSSTKFKEANDTACKLLKFSKEEFKEFYPVELSIEGAFQPNNTIKQEMVKNKQVRFETIFRTKDNGKMPVEVNAHLFSFKGKPTVVSMARDISERRKNEEILLKYQDHLEELVEERTAKLQNTNIKLNQQINERKKAEKALKQSHEQLRQLSTHLETAREDERAWIAREIHDELGQTLTALKMDVAWLANQLPKSNKPLLEKSDAILQMLKQVIQKTQKISQELHPSILDHLGFIAATSWLVEEVEKRTAIRCSLSMNADDTLLDEKSKIALFRVSQEALTNIMRHSRATKVVICFKKAGNFLILTIEDNGIGITASQITDSRSFGIMGIQERILSLNGEVKIYGKTNQGTFIKVRIPIKQEKLQEYVRNLNYG